LSGISKSRVSKLCKDIDERVNAFLDRPLTGEWPYLWLDATYLKQRESGRIVSVAAIIAVAANTDGRREIVGLHVGPSEAETFWSSFLKSLARRGLRNVKLVISDAHEGLKAAVRRVFGAGWQRCRVHWMRNALAYVPKTQQSMVAAALRQAFHAADRVSFHWRDYRHHNKNKVMTLAADEFIRRFLLHALPDGFHRIRHYGFLANRQRVEKLALCRALLAAADVAIPVSGDEERRQFADHAPDICPCCGGRMEPIGAFARSRPASSSAWYDSS
jgi:hypothetical protein